MLNVTARLADQEHGRSEAEQGVCQPEEERAGSEPGLGGDPAGHQRREGDRAVAGGLVDPGRQAPPDGTDEVDLHDHGHRPGESLVHAEQQVGRDHPRPGWGEDDQKRHRQTDEPTGDEDRFATESVGERASGKVHGRLGQPERHDEGER